MTQYKIHILIKHPYIYYIEEIMDNDVCRTSSIYIQDCNDRDIIRWYSGLRGILDLDGDRNWYNFLLAPTVDGNRYMPTINMYPPIWYHSPTIRRNLFQMVRNEYKVVDVVIRTLPW